MTAVSLPGDLTRLLTSTGLIVDDDELNFAMDAMAFGILRRMMALTQQKGVILDGHPDTDGSLKVVQGSSAGYFKVQAGTAIDNNGQIIYLAEDSAEVAVPPDSTDRNVLIEHATYDDATGTFKATYPQGGETDQTHRHDSYNIVHTTDAPTDDQIKLGVTNYTGVALEITDNRENVMFNARSPERLIARDGKTSLYNRIRSLIALDGIDKNASPTVSSQIGVSTRPAIIKGYRVYECVGGTPASEVEVAFPGGYTFHSAPYILCSAAGHCNSPNTAWGDNVSDNTYFTVYPYEPTAGGFKMVFRTLDAGDNFASGVNYFGTYIAIGMD